MGGLIQTDSVSRVADSRGVFVVLRWFALRLCLRRGDGDDCCLGDGALHDSTDS